MIRFAHLEVPDSAAMRMKRLYPGTLLKPATRQVLVPRPMTSRLGGTELRDHELLEWARGRSEEHTSELQSRGHLVCRLLLEKKKVTSIHKRDCTASSTMNNIGFMYQPSFAHI